MSARSLLLADDDAIVRRELAAFFTRLGCAVSEARDGAEAIEMFAGHGVALLDVMMPRVDGITAAAELRKRSPRVQILFLTAAPGDEIAVRALATGDDFIAKTCSEAELAARVASAFRRSELLARPCSIERIRLGRVTVDLGRRVVETDGAASAELTAIDARLLAALAESGGRAIAPGDLYALAHSGRPPVGDGGVRDAIARLRSKLGACGEAIENVRGEGYRLRMMTDGRVMV